MFTFKKIERLCSQILIDRLFNEGDSFICYPLRINLLKISEPLPYPAQVLTIVSKKRFKRAVDRNFIKRRIREAYRLNKHLLYEILKEKDINIIFSISYVGKEMPEYAQIEKQMKYMIEKIKLKV